MTFMWDGNDAYYVREFLRLSEFSFREDLYSLEKRVVREDDIDELTVYEEYTADEKYELFCLLSHFEYGKKLKPKVREQFDKSFSFAALDERSLRLIQSFIESVICGTDQKFLKRAAERYKEEQLLAEYSVLQVKIEFCLNPEFQERAINSYYSDHKERFKFKI